MRARLFSILFYTISHSVLGIGKPGGSQTTTETRVPDAARGQGNWLLQFLNMGIKAIKHEGAWENLGDVETPPVAQTLRF